MILDSFSGLSFPVRLLGCAWYRLSFPRKIDPSWNLDYAFEVYVSALLQGIHCVVPPSLTVLIALAGSRVESFRLQQERLWCSLLRD
jgi:hypothetical protein